MNPARTYDRIPNRLVLVCSEKLRFPSRITDSTIDEKNYRTLSPKSPAHGSCTSGVDVSISFFTNTST